jgi:hypothetical protein
MFSKNKVPTIVVKTQLGRQSNRYAQKGNDPRVAFFDRSTIIQRLVAGSSGHQ